MIPFIPFVIGGAIGASTTYVFINKDVKQKINDHAEQALGMVKETIKTTKEKWSTKNPPSADAEKAEEEKTPNDALKSS
jgi:hypothetical protein